MAYKNSDDDLTEEWWDVLMISPDASVRDIHQAYETLRMSYLPMNRDRSIPISAEATEQLQKLDRAFRLGLDSKNPSATLGKTTSSKTSTKAANKASTKASPRAPTGEKDTFQSVVQDWAKASSQSPLLKATSSTANAPSGAWPHTTGDTQNTQPTKTKKSKIDNATPSKKGSKAYRLLFLFIVFGIGGYLIGDDSTPTNSTPSRSSATAPPPRAAPSQAPVQTPPPQYSPPPIVADPLVVALQQELNRKGFNAGVVDGLIGPQTMSAISAAQSSFNMLIDGRPSEALLRALRRN
jgi:hypothetical protein